MTECITFIVQALPIRSVPTFIELLVGAMITQAEFATEAWLAINPVHSWNAYYKWLQQGKWSWVAAGVQMARLVVTFFPQPVWFIIFDDTFIYRSSKRAPGSCIYHQHGKKSNRPQYALGKCWVSMALSISSGGMKHSAIPLFSRLMRTAGNSSKLDASTCFCVLWPQMVNSGSFQPDEKPLGLERCVAAITIGSAKYFR